MIQAFYFSFLVTIAFLISHHIFSTISEANDVYKRLNIWIDYHKFILKCRQLSIICYQLLLTPGGLAQERNISLLILSYWTVGWGLLK